MSEKNMAGWPDEKEHVLKRMDQFDRRFDKIDAIIAEQGRRHDTALAEQWKRHDEVFKKHGEKIDQLTVEVLKIASNMGSFQSEFRLKTSSWVFLGLAIAAATAIIYILVKNQLV
jgi:hypothetical protein